MDNKVIVVGTPGVGTSHLIEHILSEVGMTMDEPIILNDTLTNGHELQEKLLAPKPEPKIMKIERMHTRELEYIPTKKEVEEYHPFAKFMGTKKRKW